MLVRDDQSDPVTVMLVSSLFWWFNNGDSFPHIGDNPIGRQDHNMKECDVDDRYVMLKT